MSNDRLPRLLYVSDVPVEASQHGSAAMFRLLQGYPSNSLLVVESGLNASGQERRLTNVRYESWLHPWRRALHSRLHSWVNGALSLRAKFQERSLEGRLRGFAPEAVLTVGHGYGWITAAAYAARRNIPLHLIMHDDWPRVVNAPALARRWIESQFASCYRQAASRLCVSSFMVEEYARRYGAVGTVLHPSRGEDTELEAAPARPADGQFVLSFGGTINTPGYARALREAAQALKPISGALHIYGPVKEEDARRAGLASENIRLRGLVPLSEFPARLRAESDMLFAPMSFDPADKTNMMLGFPSKLADYTATGLPLLIYGPEYCSAVRWARENAGVAEIVSVEDPGALSEAIRKVACSPELRSRLAGRALEVGRACFSASAARAKFYEALRQSLRA